MDNKAKNLIDPDFTVMPHVALPSPNELYPQKRPSAGKKWIVATVLVLTAAAAGVFGYKNFFKNDKTGDSSKILSPLTLPPPASQEGDTDKDGLSDQLEDREGTNFQKSDSDGDGLADGDEINVYGTDPVLEDSDRDGFNDGREVARGFSPTQNSPDRAGAAEVQKWTETIKKFGLHEPTKTTLKILAPLKDSGEFSLYTNLNYGYTVMLPKILIYREADDQTTVGIYVAGTVPQDDDLLTDPVSIAAAVKVRGQSLKDWVFAQYPAKNYEKLEETTINGIPAAKLSKVQNEVCDQEKTFYGTEQTVFIITWTCAENETFGGYFKSITESFKFTESP